MTRNLFSGSILQLISGSCSCIESSVVESICVVLDVAVESSWNDPISGAASNISIHELPV